ncbi:MAG TPA: T9SS type A sorting domain-containing protein [Candidatus Kapabacteria bacterium]|nr:T9SS type A sorting domain-containing protein [Candidatus Kapabacteria bacterium]
MDYFVSTNHYKDISNQGYACCFIKYMMILTLFSLGALPLYAQNPSAEIFVDPSNRDYPLRLTIATNARKDIASMTVRATDPTNIVAFDADTNKYFLYPLGENGMGIRTVPDTNFMPTGGDITIARFLTDSTTRQQTFTVDFLNRNGESVPSQTINVGISASVTLAPPCNRQVLDLRTGSGQTHIINSLGLWEWRVNDGNSQGFGSPPNTIYNYPARTLDPFSWYGPALSNSSWIGRHGNDNYGTVASGDYTFWRAICVSTESPAFCQLYISVDDKVDVYFCRSDVGGGGVYYRGTVIGSSSNPITLVQFNEVVTPGVNYFKFVVNNTTNYPSGPMGLRLAAGSKITLTGTSSSSLGLAGDACCRPTSVIKGIKYWDKNCDGLVTNGDSGLPGWTITVTPTTGGPAVMTAVTDAGGAYSIPVYPGTYTVSESLTGHPGWSPSTSAGPYTVTVGMNQTVNRDFLNCKKPTCEELFTVGQSDSVCCTGRFSLSNAGNTVVTSLSFVATGGVVTGVNTGCAATTSPNLTAGLSSGTFTFNPGCANMAVQFDAKSTTATGKICVKWTATFKQGTQTFTCTKEVCLNCIRMPKDCKVPLQVTPDAFPPINTESRTFTISNLKLPASQISSVDILFVNEPTPQHSGGGLIVDNISRNWTFGNSNQYNRVRMNCTGTANPHGAAANNWVKFNLGVDNTINYSGVILVKIGYCDGDTCFAEYQWKAKNIKNLPNSIETAIAIKNPRLLRFKVISPDSTRSIGIKVGDSLATIQAVTAPCSSLENDCPDIPKQFRAATKGNTAHLTFGNGECKPDPTCYCCPPEDFTLTVVYTPGTDKVDPKVPVRLSFFDKNAVEIGQAERELTSTPTSVVNNDDGNSSSNEIRIKSISPNPSNDNSVLRFVLNESSSSVNITLVDLQGRVLSTLVNNQRMDAGEHTIPFNTLSLTNGVYLLRITAEGIVVTSKFTIVR